MILALQSLHSSSWEISGLYSLEELLKVIGLGGTGVSWAGLQVGLGLPLPSLPVSADTGTQLTQQSAGLNSSLS